jgi:SAM-dependent methyltransferase
MTDIAELRERVLRDSPLPRERTEQILATYFRRTPLRTAFALERFPLATARVLDVGCSYGTSLSRFGPASVGLDNNPEAVAFCTAIGLDARLVDVESPNDLGVLGEFDFL